MIQGIAFDLDGTIVDLEHVHFGGFIHAAREFGIFLDFDELLAKIPGAIGGGDQKIAEGIACLCDGIEPARVKERKKYHYDRLLHDLTAIDPRPGFLKIFHELRGRGLKVAVGSSTTRQQGLRMMEKAQIADLFPPDCVVLAENVKNLKPAPDSYLETAHRMRISPNEQLVFEDSAVGIKAAVAALNETIASENL